MTAERRRRRKEKEEGEGGGGRSELKSEERKREASSEHFMNLFQEKARAEQSDNILPDGSRSTSGRTCRQSRDQRRRGG